MKVKFKGNSISEKGFIGALALLTFALAGCGQPNLAGVNAYNSATTPNPEQTYVMDPGSYGGIAEASGGTITGTSYGIGAKGKYDGNPSHYQKMAELRPSGEVNWSDPGPSTNRPLPAGQGN